LRARLAPAAGREAADETQHHESGEEAHRTTVPDERSPVKKMSKRVTAMHSAPYIATR
jgi:hypothetical protein